MHFAVVVVSGSDQAMAKTQSSSDISVTCTGSDAVSARALSSLCADLHKALEERYPNATFVLNHTVPAGTKAFVNLETFTASKANIDARLNWQTAGSAPVTGPRIGFSISDKDLTPDLQQKYLSRLVKETALPF